MKNQWLEFYTGIVTVKVSGKGIERFLNRLMRNEITVWNVKRHGPEKVEFRMKLKDVSTFRNLVRHTGCKVSFEKKKECRF